MKNIVFAFGRFNPPTSGHQLLVDRVGDLASKFNADGIIFLSRSEDPKKNPLRFRDKLKYCRKFFPDMNFVDDVSIKNPINAFSWIAEQGYENVYFVAGSDRLDHYKELVDHNKTRFKNIELLSSGERDSGEDTVKGMSASKMRGFVKVGDFASFRKGLPKNAKEKDAIEIYKLLQYQLNESLDSTRNL